MPRRVSKKPPTSSNQRRGQATRTRAGEPVQAGSTHGEREGSLLRTSERLVLNRCRFQHNLTYGRYLKPKVEKPPLRFGTLIHRALERYYDPTIQAKRVHPADLFQAMYEEELDRTARELPEWRDEEDVWHGHLELGIAMLTGYVDRWEDQDKEYVTLAVEQTFQMPIPTPQSDPSKPGYTPDARNALAPTIYVGTFDRVLFHRPSKRLLLGDYKTTKTDPTKTAHLTLDEQAGAYWLFAPLWLHTRAPALLRSKIHRRVRAMPPGERKRALSASGDLLFRGILYDFLKKGLPDDRPTNRDGYSLNQDGSVSKKQPGPLFHRETVLRDEHDRAKVAERVYQDAVEIGQLRAGELAIKKSPDIFHCFGGETRILTHNGIRTLRELSGHRTNVVNRFGHLESASVRYFGEQQLLRVTLDDGAIIRATPEHRWWRMIDHGNGGWKIAQSGRRITTTELDCVPIVRANVYDVDIPLEGIRHGFVFGDGYIKNGMACAYFQKPHKTMMEDYFDKSRIREGKSGKRSRLEGLPPSYKELPTHLSQSYARGFIAGLFAADGRIGKDGPCGIYCEGSDKAFLIAEIARLGGCVVSSVRLASDKPTNYSPAGATSRQLMHIQIKPSTVPLLRPEHRERLKAKSQLRRMYRKVISIEYDTVEDVYCAVVPGSESFTLASGVATSNCRMCSFTDQCELEETGADWQAYERGTTRHWDPYSAHSIEDDEHGD